MRHKIAHSCEQVRNQKQMLWPLLLLALVTLHATSCVNIPNKVVTSTPTKLTLPEDWQFRWIKGVPCRAPCWEGITPGKTSATEAIEILQHSPLVANVQRGRYAPRSGLGDVSWDWLNGQDGGFADYPINTSTQIITSINPVFHAKYRLSDVMQTYGEPSHIIAMAQQAPDMRSPDERNIFYDIWFVYLSQGLVLRGGGSIKPDLTSMVFNQIIFFIPTREELEANVWFAKKHPDWVIPWQGFKGFDFYCRDESNGEECRGA